MSIALTVAVKEAIKLLHEHAEKIAELERKITELENRPKLGRPPKERLDNDGR